ncbi:MAG: hypothetical protein VW270_12860, partial [Candidatus Poseidoniales archaeon]
VSPNKAPLFILAHAERPPPKQWTLNKWHRGITVGALPTLILTSVQPNRIMIFSMSSDLKTKQIVWTMRMNNGNSMPYALSAFAYAGGFAKTFKDEAKPISID